VITGTNGDGIDVKYDEDDEDCSKEEAEWTGGNHLIVGNKVRETIENY